MNERTETVKTLLSSYKKSLYIRRALLALLVVLTALFQNTRGALLQVNGVRAMPLAVLVAVIALFERSLAGFFFGFLAGVLWDFASAGGDGFFAVVLCLVGFLCGAASSFLLRTNVFSALAASFVSILLTLCAYWFCFLFLKGYDPSAKLLLSYYLPSCFYTLVFAPIYYYLIKGLKNALDGPKRFVTD